jgi:two-component system, OmpR family, phosphate regulon sensor histidine kinase PhoR
MLLAIVAIAGFQAYWLNKNYHEEKQLLRIRTNVLFREAVEQCRVEKLKLDTNFHFRKTGRADAIEMVNVLNRRAGLDSLRKHSQLSSTMIISMNDRNVAPTFEQQIIEGDSSRRNIRFIATPGQTGLIRVLRDVDSLQDSLTVKEISTKYAQLLSRENINLPFKITRSEGVVRDEFFPRDLESANEITIGFTRPVTYTLGIESTGLYLLKRLSIPILVSVVLVGLTVFSFLVLLRSLMQQRRLTQLKNEFVSNITHELKTPIATVGVAIEALRNFNALNDPQRTREYLDISSSEIHRLGLLVDKVLKLSMFENKEIALQRESFDLLQLTQEVLASMKLQFEKQNAVVTLETNGNNFVIEADKLHISSVIYNLLDNALKYSKGIPEIDLFLTSHPQHVSLRVRDKGIGIPKEYKGKIFEKFFRIPGGDRHNIKGYGLGLSYVNHIVKRHMGYIDVKSELGQGSEFTVNIPYKEADLIRFDEHRTIRKEHTAS